MSDNKEKIIKETMDSTEGYLNEVQMDIDVILDKGLKGKQGFFSYLNSVRKELGIRYIFNDKSELAFITILLVLACGFFGLQLSSISSTNLNFIYRLKAFTIGTAPIIYFAICSYGFISSKINRVYELQATCKYNFYNLTAIRMFIFSIASMLVNTVVISFMYLIKRNFNAIEIILLSITSLFIFSALYILTLTRLKGNNYKYILMALWLITAVVAGFQFDSKFMKTLDNISWYIHLIITFIAASIYMKSLRHLMKVKKGEI
ncbi:hypothetical protein [Clostridium manihotivorum]|uniref:Uncharacterized protein n=1 Tax=Clostridium manihotivorum TaxID=2320868 RepID=A0A3R5QUK9_9CLOT|nr:hypothetical protein [Clostridium manihotivorum]QAA33003.1 hypothetical protein C1I91_15895 [Clostridium manihotivorum]